MICGTPELVFCFELHKQSCFMWKILSFCFSFMNHPHPDCGVFEWSRGPTGWVSPIGLHPWPTPWQPIYMSGCSTDVQQSSRLRCWGLHARTFGGNRSVERWDFVHSRLDDRLHFSCFHSVHFSSRHPGRGFKPTFPCAVIPSKPVEFCCPARFFWGK